ncbi:GNAT family N-acetyltransferase [Bradyrhizobium diazoefficiens]|nr:GNAT family N-acetyltransferase [Bradyrhizobium diazoefficiens]MBR0848580.1 GNAT family N-acetyltransferase [Bradyrhizobium diazoefficiens]
MQIRDAKDDDAVQCCEVMRRSIAELCTSDHKDDPAILERWLGNKTPEVFRAWLSQSGNNVLVAIDSDRVVAVGSVTDQGQITLNYVSPDARFRGVSKSLLTSLECRAASRGCLSCTLNSTETARRFYLAQGYVETGPPGGHFGTSSGYPMSKSLLRAGA